MNILQCFFDVTNVAGHECKYKYFPGSTSSLERMFGDCDGDMTYANEPISSAQRNEPADFSSAYQEIMEYQNYVDSDWTRNYQQTTDMTQTTMFATTGNHLHSQLLRMASHIGPDINETHNKAIVIQVVNNMKGEVSVSGLFKGKNYIHYMYIIKCTIWPLTKTKI